MGKLLRFKKRKAVKTKPPVKQAGPSPADLAKQLVDLLSNRQLDELKKELDRED